VLSFGPRRERINREEIMGGGRVRERESVRERGGEA